MPATPTAAAPLSTFHAGLYALQQGKNNIRKVSHAHHPREHTYTKDIFLIATILFSCSAARLVHCASTSCRSANSLCQAMQKRRSISFHLSSVFCFFFLLVIALGLFGISRLHDFNGLAIDIADLWLPKTRVLGDLNNFTSDFRAAEGSALLAPTPAGAAASE